MHSKKSWTQNIIVFEDIDHVPSALRDVFQHQQKDHDHQAGGAGVFQNEAHPAILSRHYSAHGKAYRLDEAKAQISLHDQPFGGFRFRYSARSNSYSAYSGRQENAADGAETISNRVESEMELAAASAIPFPAFSSY